MFSWGDCYRLLNYRGTSGRIPSLLVGEFRNPFALELVVALTGSPWGFEVRGNSS